MKIGWVTFRVVVGRSVHLVLALGLFALAFGEEQNSLVRYTFSGKLSTRVDLDRVSESHLVVTDAQGYIESHAVRLSSKDGSVLIEADFMSKVGLINAIAWLVSRSGEQWNVVGTVEVERPAAPAETPTPEAVQVETATPIESKPTTESGDCTARAYDAFILAHEIENIKSSLVALAIEDPLQAALQAREAELSELLRSIAENEGPKMVEKDDTSDTVNPGQAGGSGAQVSEVPLGSQRKELEKLKHDREALEDELAAWGVM